MPRRTAEPLACSRLDASTILGPVRLVRKIRIGLIDAIEVDEVAHAARVEAFHGFHEARVKIQRKRRKLVELLGGRVVESDEHDVRVGISLDAVRDAKVVQVRLKQVEVEVAKDGGQPEGHEQEEQRPLEVGRLHRSKESKQLFDPATLAILGFGSAFISTLLLARLAVSVFHSTE